MGSRDHLFKVLVVGDAAVGKTSLVQRYSQDSFSKHYKSTVGGETSRRGGEDQRPGARTRDVDSSGVGAVVGSFFGAWGPREANCGHVICMPLWGFLS